MRQQCAAEADVEERCRIGPDEKAGRSNRQGVRRVEQHLAHFHITRNYMNAVTKADAEGRYTMELKPLVEGEAQFLRLFLPESFPALENIVPMLQLM